MITINNANTVDGERITLTISSEQSIDIDASHLMLFPGLIDPHVHFRTPGLEHKEDWRHAAKAAIYGGYTTVFDMPNTLPPTITAELLREKKALINAQLAEAAIPLRYELYFGADKHHLNQIPLIKNDVIGIKVFMGCSTGNLVIDDDESLHAVFEIAAKNNLLVAVHAEDEACLHRQKQKYAHASQYADHSKIRSIEAAVIAVDKALALCQRYQTKLYILHASTADEINLIAKAKDANLPVYAETTPHHLFLHEGNYANLLGKAVVNPPLRHASHHEALWNALRDGTIDTIGSDHAPHTTDEKSKAYGQCPSGMPGIETTLPLLLNIYHHDVISLHRIAELTSLRAKEIFNLPDSQDYTLVDLNKIADVDNAKLQTKCKWSPFHGKTLRGWPVYTIVNGKCFDVANNTI